MSATRSLFVGFAILFCAATVNADWEFAISKDATGKVIVTSPQFRAAAPGPNVQPIVPVTIAMTCTNVNCEGFKVFLNDKDIIAGAQEKTISGTISKITAGTNTLTIKNGEKDVASFNFTAGEAEASNPGGAATLTPQPVNLAELLPNPCKFNPGRSKQYDAGADHAWFSVDAQGNVLEGPAETIDEDDTVTVKIYGNAELLPLLRVRRTSTIRTLGGLNIIGEGLTVSIPRPAGKSQGDKPKCGEKAFELADFAPGRGEFEIAVYTNGQYVTTGTVEFVVSKLYDGIFSLGAITSDLTDQTFTLIEKEDQQIIAAQQEGDTTRWTVFYTPFVWAKRDPAKRQHWVEDLQKRWWHHINPSVGITTDDTADNFLAGLSVDIGPVIFVAGKHYSKITTLSEESGLKPGSPFTGTEAEIPTASRWEDDDYFGVTVDLRAALSLFRVIATGGTSQ